MSKKKGGRSRDFSSDSNTPDGKKKKCSLTLTDGELLASGSFGMVWKYTVKSDTGRFFPKRVSTVAVKFAVSYTDAYAHLTQKARKELTQKAQQSLLHEKTIYESCGPHPHILKCHGMLPVGQPALALAYCDEGCLLDYINQKQPVDAHFVLNTVLNLLSALAHLHERGIRWSDVKPDNVMLQRDERGVVQAKVGDLGLAIAKGQSATTLRGSRIWSFFGAVARSEHNKTSSRPLTVMTTYSDVWGVFAIAWLLFLRVPRSFYHGIDAGAARDRLYPIYYYASTSLLCRVGYVVEQMAMPQLRDNLIDKTDRMAVSVLPQLSALYRLTADVLVSVLPPSYVDASRQRHAGGAVDWMDYKGCARDMRAILNSSKPAAT